MGLRVGAALAAADDIQFICGLVRSSQLSTDGCLAPLSDDVDQVISDCDVLFDFTDFDRTLELAAKCVNEGRPLFVGSTVRSGDGLESLMNFAADIPIIYGPNISRGASVLFGVLETLAGRLRSRLRRQGDRRPSPAQERDAERHVRRNCAPYPGRSRGRIATRNRLVARRRSDQ